MNLASVKYDHFLRLATVATGSLVLILGTYLWIVPAFGADDNVTVPKSAIDELQAQGQATEQTALELLRDKRDWRAKAIRLDAMVTDLKAQLEAKKACPTPAEPPK